MPAGCRGRTCCAACLLVADKVQNRLDFLRHYRHYRQTHPRADALDRYFRLWLERLDMDEARHAALADDL